MAGVSTSQWQSVQRHEREFWDSYARSYVRFPQILLDHLAVIGFEIVRHDGGRDAIVGRGRLSKFLCRKPEAAGQGRLGCRTIS